MPTKLTISLILSCLMRELEVEGFIAPAECTEVRVPQATDYQMQYALAARRQQFRIAAENPGKYAVVLSLLKKAEPCGKSWGMSNQQY